MPLYLDAVVSMISGWNACRVVHLTSMLWQAVVSEQALVLQTASSAYFWSNVELIILTWSWLLLCGSMLNSLGASGMYCAFSKSDKTRWIGLWLVLQGPSCHRQWTHQLLHGRHQVLKIMHDV